MERYPTLLDWKTTVDVAIPPRAIPIKTATTSSTKLEQIIPKSEVPIWPQCLGLLLWLGFDPWPGNFYRPQVWPKEKKKILKLNGITNIELLLLLLFFFFLVWGGVELGVIEVLRPGI